MNNPIPYQRSRVSTALVYYTERMFSSFVPIFYIILRRLSTGFAKVFTQFATFYLMHKKRDCFLDILHNATHCYQFVLYCYHDDNTVIIGKFETSKERR